MQTTVHKIYCFTILIYKFSFNKQMKKSYQKISWINHISRRKYEPWLNNNN